MMRKRLAAVGGWAKRHWLVTALLLVVLAAGGWWLSSGRHREQAVLPAVKADDRVLAEGIVFPVRYAQMIMPVDGTIGEILVK